MGEDGVLNHDLSRYGSQRLHLVGRKDKALLNLYG